MKLVLLFVILTLTSCSSEDPLLNLTQTKGYKAEWKEHPRTPVPNVFGGSGRKTVLKHGFYEQSGNVPSAASWEAIAHYAYLGYRGTMIGNAGYPYSISPSGRFVVIPETYSSGEKNRNLKIFDKKRTRFVLREVSGLAIKSIKWSADERMIGLVLDKGGKASIEVPRIE